MTSPVYLNKIPISNQDLCSPINLSAPSNDTLSLTHYTPTILAFLFSKQVKHFSTLIPLLLQFPLPRMLFPQGLFTWLGISHSSSWSLNSVLSERFFLTSLTKINFAVLFCVVLFIFFHSIITIYNYCNNLKNLFPYLISSPD